MDLENAKREPSEATIIVTKSSIIDQELNRYGMGRYQWLIWGVCGTGFLLDLMWAQAFGLTVSSIQRELGFSDKEYGNISITFSAGMAAGAFTWGALVDVVGRRVAFFAASFITGVFGTCAGFLSSYNSLLVFVTFIGFGIGGNLPVDSTITLEYLPKDRFYLLAALSIFQPTGCILTTLIAFGLMPKYSCSPHLVSCHITGGVTPCCLRDANMGWRYVLFAIGAITLAVFILRFFIFPFYESPKFLLAKGNDRSAVEVVCKIAAFNKRPCDLTVESLYERSDEPVVERSKSFSRRFFDEISRFKVLFGSLRMVRVTILVWITWTFCYWAYGITTTYFPAILQRKNAAIHASLEQTYIDYVIVYTPGIMGVVLSVLLVRSPAVGRKWTLVASSVLASMSIFLYINVNSEANEVGLNMLQYFFQCLFSATLVGWTPEAFPVAVRGTASGWALSCASMLGIPGLMLAEQLFGGTKGSNAVLYLAGGAMLVPTISLLCIPMKDMVAPR